MIDCLSTELPPTGLTYEMCVDCNKIKRFVFFGRNISLGEGKYDFNWMNDKTTRVGCVDLKGVVVNSSTILTDYKRNGDLFEFDWIEFFGTQFNVYRLSLTKEKINEDIQLVKSGTIRSIFGCPPPTTKPMTTKMPETTETIETTETTTEAKVTQTEIPVTTVKPDTEKPTTQSTQPKSTPNDILELESTGLPVNDGKKSGIPLIVILLIVLIAVVIIVLLVWLWVLSRNRQKPQILLVPASEPSRISLSSRMASTSTIGEGSNETKRKIPTQTKSIRSHN